MNTHGRKMIAPLIVTVCLSAYYLAAGIALYTFHAPGIIVIAAVFFSAVITALLIAVFIERVREIKRGEEDDLGKY